MTEQRLTPKRPNAKLSYYNRLAKNKRAWDKEAKRVTMKLSNSKYAAPKVEPKPYQYTEAAWSL